MELIQIYLNLFTKITITTNLRTSIVLCFFPYKFPSWIWIREENEHGSGSTALVDNMNFFVKKLIIPNQICIVPFGTLFSRTVFKH